MNLTLTNARCDSLNCGSRHCGSKKLLASRLSYKFAISHIHISIYLLYTYIYTYACIKILYVRDIRWNRRACPRIYIYIYKGWRRKSGHAEIFFRAFPLQVRGCERTNYRTWSFCKALEEACYNYDRFDAFMQTKFWRW